MVKLGWIVTKGKETMSKYTKVFDLKTRIKVSQEIPNEEVETIINGLIGAAKDESDPKKQHEAKYLLASAVTRGVDGMLEAILHIAIRKVFREEGGEVFGFGYGDDVTVSPPQLVFKR